ncbi:MAG: hypothetical protein EA370_02850 [Wenzhouxiangella sp.]|nr:MAG: hypothetical protein EA370_02850 [Wenzhouxiangella sp.]
MDAWKLWIIAGIVLAIAELLLIPAQFLLVALGLCAMLVGILTWGADLGQAAQLGWFAGLSIVLVPLFVTIWRRKAPVRYPGTAGESGTAPQSARIVNLDPLTIALRGDRFPAKGPGDCAFEIGEEVMVTGFSGITAEVRKIG